jgi:hypothetical protein
MKNNQSDNRHDIGGDQGSQGVLSKVKITQTIVTSTTSKSSQSHSAEVGGNTRISSRRFTRTDKTVELKSFDFAGVDTSGVISTGSLSAPDAYLAAIAQLEKSGVLSFNDIDILPTHDLGTQGVIDAHALIEDFNAWSMQGDVDALGKEGAPCKCAPRSHDSIAVDALGGHASQEKVGKSCCKERSTRSEKITVIHTSILSRKAEVLHV